MSVDISREELYELVWSTPLVHAAKKFGISDVMLGRICKERNIPRPPRGYWVSLQSVSQKNRWKYTKPPLPKAPEPEKSFNNFMAKEYEAREAGRTDLFDPYNLDDPVRPGPVPIAESLDDFKKRIEGTFPKLIEPAQLTTLHPILKKVLNQDLIVAANLKRDRLAPSPRYQCDKGKILLGLLNFFITNFDRLGFVVTVRGRIHFSYYVHILKKYEDFHVCIRGESPSFYRRKRVGDGERITYQLSWSQEYEARRRDGKTYEFDELNSSCIRKIVMDLVMRNEKEYRDYVFSSYRNRVECRESVIKRRELEIKREEEQKRKALAELLANRGRYMADAVSRMNHADKIRELIKVMQLKAEASSKPINGFARWVSWATHHANSIDPRSRSLEGFEAWIDKFELKH